MKIVLKILAGITALSLLFLVIFVSPKIVHATGFSYYRSITIDHTKVGTVNNTDQPSFPVEVSLSDATLSYASGHVKNANGYDIYFYSDSGLTTRLPAEREKYTDSGGIGTYIGWVQVPTVSHSTNTVIYIAYGNSGISSDPNSDATYGATKVWDTNYKAVYHLPNGSSLTINDSTSGGLGSGTSDGAGATAGQIDGGASFGAATGISLGNTSVHFNPLTVEAWVNPSSFPSQTTIVSKGYNGNTEWSLDGETGGHIVWSVYNGSSIGVTSAGTIPTSSWSHIVGVYDGTKWYLYINGTADGNSPVTGIGPISTNQEYEIGAVAVNGSLAQQPWFGSIDEVRISNSVRSADWVKTEYNNQLTPGNIGSPGFYTVGSETTTVASPTRIMMLFQGYKIKFLNGRIVIKQH
jgi:Concanavalin A-like lectin/glucanases superfamily/Domain of unknown function (DUF2341)